ncbi:AAA family ATPase [Rhodoblastus sp.]|uniref:AAA family ATPase n=1 Tax=Rhodoblastus sp. TaxID=1962975 RepID=UPI003F987530
MFDPDLFRREAQRIADADGPDEDFDFFADSAQGLRAKYLFALANDARQGARDLLIPTAATVTRLLSAEAEHPNFWTAAGVYIRAARLSALSQAPLVIPPLLLVGPPGVGKTHFARAVAQALNTDFHEISGPGLDDEGVLGGHSLGWRGARAGAIARALIDGPSAQPVFFIDEIDKVPSWRESDPLDLLHIALEPLSARNFRDSYLEAPIAADKIIWIAAANDASALRRSILDRFLVVPVSAPEKDAAVAITKRIYRAATEQYRAILSQDLDDEVAKVLVDATPRRLRLVFQIAAGFAAADGRTNLSLSDIENARRLLAAEQRKTVGILNL